LSEQAFLFDSNLWVALAFEDHPTHDLAQQALARATVSRPACFCRSTELSFLRLASTPALHRMYGASTATNEDVLRTYESFTSHPAVAWREEPAGIASHWPKLASRTTASPKVWMDAYLAAFAIAGDLTLVTADADFKGFTRSGLTLHLIEAS
jgi:toxin-antitoxin system PIN domain toxin